MDLKMSTGQSHRAFNEVIGCAILQLRSHVVKFHLHRDRHVSNRTDHNNVGRKLRAMSEVSICPVFGRGRIQRTVLDVELVIVSEDFNGLGADAGHGRRASTRLGRQMLRSDIGTVRIKARRQAPSSLCFSVDLPNISRPAEDTGGPKGTSTSASDTSLARRQSQRKTPDRKAQGFAQPTPAKAGWRQGQRLASANSLLTSSCCAKPLPSLLSCWSSSRAAPLSPVAIR